MMMSVGTFRLETNVRLGLIRDNDDEDLYRDENGWVSRMGNCFFLAIVSHWQLGDDEKMVMSYDLKRSLMKRHTVFLVFVEESPTNCLAFEKYKQLLEKSVSTTLVIFYESNLLNLFLPLSLLLTRPIQILPMRSERQGSYLMMMQQCQCTQQYQSPKGCPSLNPFVGLVIAPRIP